MICEGTLDKQITETWNKHRGSGQGSFNSRPRQASCIIDATWNEALSKPSALRTAVAATSPTFHSTLAFASTLIK